MKLSELKQAVFDLACITDTAMFRDMFPELANVFDLRLKKSWQEILEALEAESRAWLRQIWDVTMAARRREFDRIGSAYAMSTHNLPDVLTDLFADMDAEDRMVAMAQAAATVSGGNATREYAEAEAFAYRDTLLKEGRGR